MMRPVNIYSLSRIHDEEPFNIVEQHHSQRKESRCKKTKRKKAKQTKTHEMESLRLLSDELLKNGVAITNLDGFFFSFKIPQIGKEFDLLKFTDKLCLNIELKSTSVPKEQILEQLLKNRHYLSHLGKKLMLYSVVTDTMTCYKLLSNDKLISVKLSSIVCSIKKMAEDYSDTIDDLFRPSDFLVSPLNTPERFIQGKYFLTNDQEAKKKTILSDVDAACSGFFIHLTGKPGTGKTLLLYDLAKMLSHKGKTLIIHCGQLSSGQEKIRDEIEKLDIILPKQLDNADVSLADYSYILVDETHRIYPGQFEKVCDSVRTNNQICILSSDPEQILSKKEEQRDIVNEIKAIPPDAEYTLSETIRTNKELYFFIKCMKNLKNINKYKKTSRDFLNVELNYANTTKEAKSMLRYYRKKGYTFINYSKSHHNESPYSAYTPMEDHDTHNVIGQEFDNIVMLMDSSFYYDVNGVLQGKQHPTPDYLYPNLFYQGVTRVREKLAIIVVEAPELFINIVSIVKPIE